MATLEQAQWAAEIVRDAGGRIVGRTRFQKIAFLLEVAGLGNGFLFSYRHYGPYSDELSSAARAAAIMQLVQEHEQPTTWGGTYSTFTTDISGRPNNAARNELAQFASDADSVELELAATALFLSMEGAINAWQETAQRKPDKSDDGRLERAKILYDRLRAIDTPNPLPVVH